MPLSAGARLGPYEIQSPLGAGGMGEVYRAHDTTLGRAVALKVLPDAFSRDLDHLARFEREARALAAVNHPHIAQIYGLEKTGDTRALVMELVEGPTLAEYIVARAGSTGPGLRMDEALAIARQIAEALEAAHEQGIVHRDLKPSNIKVRSDGTVKVLDFGLAKLAQGPGLGPQAPDLTASPTITSPALHTGVGVLLGTAAYMSPEQARGQEADRRADLWAFGCVLFEMLTGRRAFDGAEVAAVLARVLERGPDWALLPRDLPPAILRLLRRCLQKDRTRRWQSAGDLRVELDELRTEPDAVVSTTATSPRLAGRERIVRGAVVAAAVGVTVATLLLSWSRPGTPQSAALRVSADLGAPVSLVTAQGAAAVLSPDGMTIAFVGRANTRVGPSQQLYVRRFDQLAAQPLGGTDGAMNPFFSSDGRWIGFFADGKLRKIAVTGGSAIALADALNGRGGSWGEDDTIVYAPDVYGGVWRVSSTGGNATQVTTPVDGEVTHRWPQWLPNGQGILYTSNTTNIGYEGSSLILQPMPDGARRVVLAGAYHGRYLPSGHLVYMHEGSLFATPFALDGLEATGTPVPVVGGVASGAVFTAGAQFAVAGNGTLLYMPSDGDAVPMQWLDESGNVTFLRESPANWSDPSFAPDGRRLAVSISNGSQSDIWVYDWARDALSRLTFDPGPELKSAWTPDGRRIAFGSTRRGSGVSNLSWQRVDGTGDVERLTESKNFQYPSSFHPSGRFLAYLEFTGASFDVMVLPLEGDETSGWKAGTSMPFVNGPANEIEPMFSPDGRWLAYASNESGRFEVYVRPFPGPGGRWQISTSGGSFPTWSRARQELFYSTLDQRIMVAPYSVEGASFRPDRPRLWGDRRHSLRGPFANRSFDLHPDGKRVALAAVPESEAVEGDKVVLVFNFFEELRRLVPVH